MRHTRREIFSIATDQIDLRLLSLRTPTALALKRMATSLQKVGQLTPLIIAQQGENPIQAKAMMYLMNRAGSFSMIQEALLARELVDTDGLSQTEAAGLLQRHKSRVSRRLLMIRRLAPEIIEDLNLQLLPPGSAPALARIPLCNQPDFSAAIQTHQLSVKELNSVIALWCKATDPGIKQSLLQAPKEALQVIEEEKDSPERILPGMWKLLASLERQSRRRAFRESLHQIKSALMAIEQTLSQESIHESPE